MRDRLGFLARYLEGTRGRLWLVHSVFPQHLGLELLVEWQRFDLRVLLLSFGILFVVGAEVHEIIIINIEV